MNKFNIKRLLGLLVICAMAAGAVKFGGTVVYAEDGEIGDEGIENFNENSETAVLDEQLDVNQAGIETKESEIVEQENEFTAKYYITWIGNDENNPPKNEDKNFIVGKNLLEQLPDYKTYSTSNGCASGWKYTGGAPIGEDDKVEEMQPNAQPIGISPIMGAHGPIVEYGEEVDATCTTEGSTKGTKCGNCGRIITESETISSLDHQWETEWTNDDPAGHYHKCTRDGCDEKKDEAVHQGTQADDNSMICEECGYVMIAAHEHTADNLEEYPDTQATCGEPGIMRHWECTEPGCNKYFLIPSNGEPEEVTLDIIKVADPTGEHKWITDENGNRVCEICGQKPEPAKPSNPGNPGTSGGSHSSSNSSGSSGSSSAASAAAPASAAPAAVTGSGNPQTNDTSNPGLWTVLSILSGLAVLAGVNFGKGKKKVHR